MSGFKVWNMYDDVIVPQEFNIVPASSCAGGACERYECVITDSPEGAPLLCVRVMSGWQCNKTGTQYRDGPERWVPEMSVDDRAKSVSLQVG